MTFYFSKTKTYTTPIGGRAYPVRHYPIAARLRTRKGYAILCIASFPQSGDSSDSILEVPFKALLHAKCSTYALFLYKNAFFPKKICVCAFFVVPLQPISELTRSDGPDGGIGRRAGLKHQWSNPCRFDPGSGYKDRLTTS